MNQESAIQDSNETVVIDEWFTPEEAGCTSEDVLCMVTPGIEVFEENTWKVQPCANEECGSFSPLTNFNYTYSNEPRFTYTQYTVTDTHTNLTWYRYPSMVHCQGYPDCVSWLEGWSSLFGCEWRIPTLAEMMTLIDGQYDSTTHVLTEFVNQEFKAIVGTSIGGFYFTYPVENSEFGLATWTVTLDPYVPPGPPTCIYAGIQCEVEGTWPVCTGDSTICKVVEPDQVGELFSGVRPY